MIGGVAVSQHLETILTLDFQQIADIGEEFGNVLIAKTGHWFTPVVECFVSWLVKPLLAATELTLQPILVNQADQIEGFPTWLKVPATHW
ncbi:MAG: hypothetical protein BroJett011_36580 [Chloroflexota bacterium]|nr:MAG: hypothetical protein BroJett011_36580 [Chloroflexota bacterium]